MRSSVGVKDQPRCGLTLRDGHLEGVTDQVGPHVIGHGEADDAAAGQIDDRGQVEPALPGADVGDVPAPRRVELVGLGREGPLDQVRSERGGVRIGDGRPLEAAFVAPDEPSAHHETGDALLPTQMPDSASSVVIRGAP